MSVTTPQIPSSNGEPAWEAAYMLPVQGSWSEEDFLKFHTNRMAELVDGRLEILPMPTHIDLALEIVSPGKDARQRDYEDKRIDYARAGISEYWIVDPLENQVTVLVLQDSIYTEHGVFRIGDVASGLLLPALSLDVRAMLNA